MRFARLAALAAFAVLLLLPPFPADAQPPVKPARIGLLFGAAPAFDPSAYDQRALLAGLQAHGYAAAHAADPRLVRLLNRVPSRA